jgi:hypothetical protein
VTLALPPWKVESEKGLRASQVGTRGIMEVSGGVEIKFSLKPRSPLYLNATPIYPIFHQIFTVQFNSSSNQTGVFDENLTSVRAAVKANFH